MLTWYAFSLYLNGLMLFRVIDFPGIVGSNKRNMFKVCCRLTFISCLFITLRVSKFWRSKKHTFLVTLACRGNIIHSVKFVWHDVSIGNIVFIFRHSKLGACEARPILFARSKLMSVTETSRTYSQKAIFLSKHVPITQSQCQVSVRWLSVFE